MHMIFACFYDDISKEKFIELLPNSIEILWDYKKYEYEYECSEGIEILKKFYDFKELGVVLDKNQMEHITSSPLIYQVYDYYLEDGSEFPPLLELFQELEKCKINKMGLVFADEWDEKTLIRIESIKFEDIICKVGGVHTWYEAYTDLSTKITKFYEDRPLILLIENK